MNSHFCMKKEKYAYLPLAKLWHMLGNSGGWVLNLKVQINIFNKV